MSSNEVPLCVVKLCTSYTENSKNSGISFHPFPSNPVIYNAWVNIIRRNHNDNTWKPTEQTVICSNHFCNNDFYITRKGFRKLCEGAIPKKNITVSVVTTKPNDYKEKLELIHKVEEIQKKMTRKTELQKKHRLLINSLHRRINRLRKSNTSLKQILKTKVKLFVEQKRHQ